MIKFKFLIFICFFIVNSAFANICDNNYIFENYNKDYLEENVLNKLNENISELSYECAKLLSGKDKEMDKLLLQAGFPSLITFFKDEEIIDVLYDIVQSGNTYYFNKDYKIYDKLNKIISENKISSKTKYIYDYILSSSTVYKNKLNNKILNIKPFDKKLYAEFLPIWNNSDNVIYFIYMSIDVFEKKNNCKLEDSICVKYLYLTNNRSLDKVLKIIGVINDDFFNETNKYNIYLVYSEVKKIGLLKTTKDKNENINKIIKNKSFDLVDL